MKIKNIKWLMVTFAVACLFSGCSDDWDDHYKESSLVINNDELKNVDQSSEVYLQSQSDLSDMYVFLKDNGIFSRLKEKNLLHTLLVVKNDVFSAVGADGEELDSTQLRKLANSHVSDIAISPANLYDGERILMWHDKFLSVAIDSTTAANEVARFSFSGCKVSEIIKTNDGYIYVLDGMVKTPQSLMDLINGLDDEKYSIFKDLVLSSGGKEFDKEHSKPIGVDETGNTVYDSVFIYTNEFFDAKEFDLSSESLTATALIFSNDVINRAMAVADSTLQAWNADRDREVLRRWILEVAFYKKRYSETDLSVSAANKLVSIYDRQWHTDIQKVDINNMETVSNGVAFYVTDFKIPNNMLIYRLKDFYYYYENCDDIQKAQYFKAINLSDFSCETQVAAWTPLIGVWPTVENRVLKCKYTDTSLNSFTLDFTPLKRTVNQDGGYDIQPYLIPPGTYRLAMGFKQSMNIDVEISILVNGVSLADPVTITLGSATTFHYDRGATLNDGYPEGYNEVKGELTDSKKNNYDTDGGLIYNEITIPDVKGDGSPTAIVIRVENTNLAGTTSTLFHHWCLRPTENNY